jgi:lipopolysaccharide transport system ATP-binding protein
MSKPHSEQFAVRVEGLSKSYSIAPAHQRHDRATDAIMHRLLRPFERPPMETFWALRDVSFEVAAGEVVGIIGHNGAGKSTLLKILSRITEPTSGRIDLYGRIGSLLEVGTGFHPDLTGRENVFLNGAILGMTRREIARHFDAIVDFAGVEQFIDTPVKRYSSGMYVRLAFAVAAHLEPEILIVDEVLAVGDASFQKKCLGKMQDVARQGRTILFVSHNMGAVRGLCEKVLWMEHGKPRELGFADEVIDDYLKENVTATYGTIDLRHVERPNWIIDPPLRICSIEFNGGNSLRHGEMLTLRIEYETNASVDGVALGVGFSTLDGQRLLTVESDLLDGRKDLRASHSGVVEATVQQLYLQPGRYLLDLGARSGDYHTADYLPGFAQVEILPGPTTPSTIIREGAGVRMPASWLWKQDSEPLVMASKAKDSGTNL